MPHVMMVIKGKAATGKRDALYGLFEQHLAPRALTDDAQQLVVWAANEGDAEGFTLVEIYSDPTALERNSQAQWFWAYMAEAGPLLDGEPTVAVCSPRWAKGTAL